METNYILYGIIDKNNKVILKQSKFIQEIDNFTRCFGSKEEMYFALFNKYQLKDLILVKKNQDKIEEQELLFHSDNYKDEKVIDSYREYLWANQDEIKNTDLVYLNINYMIEFYKTGVVNFTEREFNKLIHAYFFCDKNTFYNKVRKAYLKLSSEGLKQKCKRKIL